MPVVRRAERQVGIDPLQGGRRTAARTAEAEGAGLEQARAERAGASAAFGDRAARIGVGLFTQIRDEERRAADQTALMAASNKLSAWKNARLYDPNSGAFTRKGEAALPLPEELRAEFDKLAGEVSAGLSSAAQREAFDRMKFQEWDSIDLQVRRHVFGEMQEYRAGELKGLVENSINSAVQNAADPKLVAVDLQKAVSAIQTSGPGLGLGKEAIDAQVREVTSRTHVGVISQLLAKEDDQAASAYFAATKDQIAGDKYDEITKALEEGQLRGQSQRAADEIVRAGGTLTEQREKARQITDSKLRDQVMQRVEHEAAVRERETREREESSMREGYDILDRTADVSKIPAPLWTSYSGATRSAMIHYAQTRAAGEPVVTDLPTFYSLMQQAGDDPVSFAKRNLLEVRHKLDEAEFKQLSSLQLSIKNADRAAVDKDLAPFRTKTQLVDDTLTLHGIDPSAKPDTPEGKAIAQLRRMVDTRVDLLQGGGKKATNEDIQAEIDRILSAKTTVPGSWWNIFPGGKSFTDSEKRLIDLTIADVPTTERSLIEDALRRSSRPVTDATVLDLYLETKLRERR